MGRLEVPAREGYDPLIGLEAFDVAVDGCLTKAPCGAKFLAQAHRTEANYSFCCSMLSLSPPQMLRVQVSGPAFPRSVQQSQTRISSSSCRTPPGQ